MSYEINRRMIVGGDSGWTPYANGGKRAEAMAGSSVGGLGGAEEKQIQVENAKPDFGIFATENKDINSVQGPSEGVSIDQKFVEGIQRAVSEPDFSIFTTGNKDINPVQGPSEGVQKFVEGIQRAVSELGLYKKFNDMDAICTLNYPDQRNEFQGNEIYKLA